MLAGFTYRNPELVNFIREGGPGPEPPDPICVHNFEAYVSYTSRKPETTNPRNPARKTNLDCCRDTSITKCRAREGALKLRPFRI